MHLIVFHILKLDKIKKNVTITCISVLTKRHISVEVLLTLRLKHISFLYAYIFLNFTLLLVCVIPTSLFLCPIVQYLCLNEKIEK